MTEPHRHADLLGDTRRRVVELLRRSDRTVVELAEILEITPNAVRIHVTALERDGYVQGAGVRREGVGKPASVYALTPKGESLFPKAYAAMLGEVLVAVTDRLGTEAAEEVLREVAHRLAAKAAGNGTRPERVEAARALLESLGAPVEVHDGSNGTRIEGYACPLGAVTREHPELCETVRQAVEEVVRAPVRTRCRRDRDRPRCAFEVAAG